MSGADKKSSNGVRRKGVAWGLGLRGEKGKDFLDNQIARPAIHLKMLDYD